ncbi:2-C-methyl-D-erythritol 4-phosphate cytidylyltransferase [Candidatus Dojkabacteria bacterium]|jgi:bifunctional N-acetylglucosamine-1-phosphate-uridyltransferase/glucosamine-1-phosphate-acetyltransferase GlmU-like protein|nr:2-C-methyl-D-erythritol 4-phosphate cytidylyltransferase [Candidatus Dojkabacteria bacterium]
MNAEVIILAAGKQTRFKNKLPKILSKIDDHTILDRNIKHFANFKINLVINKNNTKYFKKYKDKVNIIEINGGLGSGGDLIEILPQIKSTICLLIWGDVIIGNCNEFNKIVNNLFYLIKDYDIVVPARLEKNPYIDLICKEGQIEKIHLPNTDEIRREYGLHDLSFFVFKKNKIQKYLIEMLKMKPEGFGFLEIFNLEKKPKHSTTMCYNKINESFNTVQELRRIKNGNCGRRFR